MAVAAIRTAKASKLLVAMSEIFSVTLQPTVPPNVAHADVILVVSIVTDFVMNLSTLCDYRDSHTQICKSHASAGGKAWQSTVIEEASCLHLPCSVSLSARKIKVKKACGMKAHVLINAQLAVTAVSACLLCDFMTKQCNSLSNETVFCS